MTNLTGHSLGRYHILEQLGEGGMATVYKAYDTRLEREVAVKVIRVDQFGQAVIEGILKRFEREAKALARLTHPNIVHINDYGEHEGVPYLVMDYLPGGTLKERMRLPISWQAAARLLLPVLSALEYAHEHKIVHRDVKPANILLTEKGQPMLTDFGIAKLLETEAGQTLTGTGVGIGTPEYMAPEQGLGKPVDGRADLYSLGIVFYELVTGRKPYTADTPMAVVFKHISDPLPNPRQFAPDLPESVARILFKALAKAPEDRYPDAQAFAGALEKLLQTLESPANRATELPASVSQTVDWTLADTPTLDQPVSPRAAPVVESANVVGKPAPAWKRMNVRWLGLGLGALLLVAALLGWLGSGGGAALFLVSTPSQTIIATLISTLTPTNIASRPPVPTLTTQPSFDYKVSTGDTCSSIALTFGVSVQSIIILNNLPVACNTLSIGQPLKIPYPTPTPLPQTGATTFLPDQATKQACEKVIYTVQGNDTLNSISANYAVPAEAIKSYNGLSTDTIFLGMSLVVPLCERTAIPEPTLSLGIGSILTREKDGMVMVYVPEGPFTMGSDNSINGDSGEKPAHTVTLDAYWIDQTEVTNGMYTLCVQVGVCTPPSSKSSHTRDNYYGNPQYADFPVIYMNWNQAKSYCEWTGSRLPSEAEWEKAARGTDGRTYPWGEGIDNTHANYNRGGSDTTKVGSYPAGASPYEALDMAGNVWEWVNDWYSDYSSSPSSNPIGPDSGPYRVLRGGAWNLNSNYVRTTFRAGNVLANSFVDIGIRCARLSP